MKTAKGPRRSPRFALSSKPLYVHLSELERGELERAAQAQNRSLSSTARSLLIGAMRAARLAAGKPEG
ncbi:MULTISPECIES: hypothetical protein [Burkholderia]|uniref:Gp12 n=2 Tax=Burkholderia gladioli TaxID=28095 RepID=A0A095XDJ3_BURGA|nr:MULTISPECIES: hypothetical protein [Burkholderia]AEA58832.1 hypothetical protein bgla_1g01310 [Burkholderia gladioli BSR3]AJW99211.1 putative gp12 [Burkholderia gladioli]ASD77664.1 hypothetical protein CEJ98_00665 [Burkholderia gladioli pv. gladioli]ATF85892.1 hypothetical protein CO712_13075 [Burkholderia gladioli pv. gladioli]AWY53424.1 hypothetical protein A8H28_19355 [Burkholderia gladioli pv. gladioli]